MKKNENIFITLQIQKDQESKALCILVQFDKNAPNFSLEEEAIIWRPTSDELGFIAEAFNLIGGYSNEVKAMGNMQQNDNTREPTTIDPPYHSSEIRVAPPSDDTVIEVATDEGSSYIKKKPTEDRIFVQADDKTIDEALKRKKGIDEDYGIESSEKTLIDRMLKQKKKKE